MPQVQKLMSKACPRKVDERLTKTAGNEASPVISVRRAPQQGRSRVSMGSASQQRARSRSFDQGNSPPPPKTRGQQQATGPSPRSYEKPWLANSKNRRHSPGAPSTASTAKGLAASSKSSGKGSSKSNVPRFGAAAQEDFGPEAGPPTAKAGRCRIPSGAGRRREGGNSLDAKSGEAEVAQLIELFEASMSSNGESPRRRDSASASVGPEYRSVITQVEQQEEQLRRHASAPTLSEAPVDTRQVGEAMQNREHSARAASFGPKTKGGPTRFAWSEDMGGSEASAPSAQGKVPATSSRAAPPLVVLPATCKPDNPDMGDLDNCDAFSFAGDDHYGSHSDNMSVSMAPHGHLPIREDSRGESSCESSFHSSNCYDGTKGGSPQCTAAQHHSEPAWWETPREAAIRRKREAADREMEYMKQVTRDTVSTEVVKRRPPKMSDTGGAPEMSDTGGPRELEYSGAREVDYHGGVREMESMQSAQPQRAPPSMGEAPQGFLPAAFGFSAPSDDFKSMSNQMFGSAPSVLETPREGALRRKREAADREVERLRAIQSVTERTRRPRPQKSISGIGLVDVPEGAQSPCERADMQSLTLPLQNMPKSPTYEATSDTPSPGLRAAQPSRSELEMEKNEEKQSYNQPRTATAADCINSWPSPSRSDCAETPRDAARRRKMEAADRHLQTLKETHAEAAEESRKIALRQRDSQNRFFNTPWGTAESLVHSEVSSPLLTSEPRTLELPGQSTLTPLKDGELGSRSQFLSLETPMAPYSSC